METTDIINLVITVIIPLLVYLFGPALRTYFQQKATMGTNEHLYQMAEVFVKSAEQLFGGDRGNDKLEYAMHFLRLYAEKKKIKLDDTTMRAFIEAAVNDVTP